MRGSSCRGSLAASASAAPTAHGSFPGDGRGAVVGDDQHVVLRVQIPRLDFRIEDRGVREIELLQHQERPAFIDIAAAVALVHGHAPTFHFMRARRDRRAQGRKVNTGPPGTSSSVKLFERIYAPLTAGLLAPLRVDRALSDGRRCALDHLYQRICDDLDARLKAVGLKIAA